MRALVLPSESAPLLRLAAFPEFDVDPEQLRAGLAAKRATPLVAVLETSTAGKNVLAAIAELGRVAPPNTTKASAYLEAVLRRFRMDRQSKSMQTFVEFVAKWEAKPIAGEGTVVEFLAYLEMFRDFGGAVPLPADDEEDAVRLMTAHNAKGREFRHVYVVRACTGSFPLNYKETLFEFPRELRGDISADRESKELNAEEERRLFYVAMTRAKETLTLLASKDRWGKPWPWHY